MCLCLFCVCMCVCVCFVTGTLAYLVDGYMKLWSLRLRSGGRCQAAPWEDRGACIRWDANKCVRQVW